MNSSLPLYLFIYTSEKCLIKIKNCIFRIEVGFLLLPYTGQGRGALLLFEHQSECNFLANYQSNKIILE